MIRRSAILVAVLISPSAPLFGQSSDEVARATEFAVPSVPAFVLLDVNPAQVARPAFAKDFTLDLLVKDRGLAPDLALEFHPAWIFFFEDVDHQEYREMHPAIRLLSTLSLSAATAEKDERQNLAWAAKLSLISPDPLLDAAYNSAVSDALDISDEELALLQELDDSLEAANTDADRQRLIARYQSEIVAAEDAATELVREAVSDFHRRSWNAEALDVAIGQTFRYGGETLGDLDFDASGVGAWVSGGTGLGTEHFLVTGLAKIVQLGDDEDLSIGGNVRFGASRASGFVEFVHHSPGDDLSDTRTISYGGEFRLDNERKIELGIRTGYDDDFDLRELRPIIKLDWTVGGFNLGDLLGSD
jgi:hypothetical protein